MFKTLEQVKEDHVRAVLEKHPTRAVAAEILDVNPRTLRNMIRDYKIEIKNVFKKRKILNTIEDNGYRSVTPEERDDWYNRDRF